MKNYMANKSFSRGVETLGAEASMVFVGNTTHTVPYMLKHADLFCDLPEKYHDSAFLDRLHFYLPGWEIDIIRGEMFTSGYGFVVDYLAEILRNLRNHDYSQSYREHFELLADISTRDRDGIHKTFSGLMKVLYPSGEATREEIEELLVFAIEGRKRVKDQLLRIDKTYAKVRFGYEGRSGGETVFVRTLEEEQYTDSYGTEMESEPSLEEGQGPALEQDSGGETEAEQPKAKHLQFKENQRGVSYDMLFAPYLKGARRIDITDPYIRLFYQIRNLMEFLETVARCKAEEDEVEVHLLTISDEIKAEQQHDMLSQIQTSCAAIGIHFSWEYDYSNSIHARHIVTDTGWKILLDRGLDIFQQYEMNDAFSITNRMQEYRACKAFEVTYLKQD